MTYISYLKTTALTSIIGSMLFIMPMTAWGNECNAIIDQNKRNSAGQICVRTTTGVQWSDAPRGSIGTGPQTVVEDSAARLNNQLNANNGQFYVAPNQPTSATGQGIGTTPNPSQKFTPLSGIPGLTHDPSGNVNTNITLDGLLQAAYRLAIVLGALAAVVKITLAGLKYMGSDNIGDKGGAKEDIEAALFGLLILLSTVLILETIFGSVNINVLSRMSPLEATGLQQVVSGSQVSGSNPLTFNRRNGCLQTSAAGRACKTGEVGTISGTSIKCADPDTIPLIAGQDSFRPITERECQQNATYYSNILHTDKNVYGQSDITVSALRAKYPGMGNSPAVEKYMKEVLEPACKKLNGNAKVGNENITVGGSFLENTLKFSCIG